MFRCAGGSRFIADIMGVPPATDNLPRAKLENGSFPVAVRRVRPPRRWRRPAQGGQAQMPIRELAELAWEEVRDLDRARTVAVLPVGAIEAHGPHLPLGTDVVIAHAMARAGAQRIADGGLGAVLLPPLPFTAAPFGARFAGTISISPATVTALVLDLARE